MVNLHYIVYLLIYILNLKFILPLMYCFVDSSNSSQTKVWKKIHNVLENQPTVCKKLKFNIQSVGSYLCSYRQKSSS